MSKTDLLSAHPVIPTQTADLCVSLKKLGPVLHSSSQIYDSYKAVGIDLRN